MIRKIYKPIPDLNPPWVAPPVTEEVTGYYYDANHKLKKVTVIFARHQWLTLKDKAIDIIGWK